MDRLVSIAIIGGGFSGISTAIHLIENAYSPIVIYLIEKQSELCKGIAYGTRLHYHPLNVRAGRMGALAKEPSNFYSWLETYSDLWRNLDATFASLKITPDSYVPRKLYAAYLQDLFCRYLATAQEKNIICTILHDQAMDVEMNTEGRIEVFLEKEKPLLVDHLVLAMGTSPSQKFSFETMDLLENPQYICDIWNLSFEKRLRDLCAGNGGKEKMIAIIGSGLTTIDALFTLHSINYQGTVHLISKNGILPQVHTEKLLPEGFDFKDEEFPNKASDLLHMFKRYLKQAEAAGLDWRQLIDALRPYTQAIWHSLSVTAKKQFMRHLFSLWNKHRHRMSPQSGEIVESFKKKNALTLFAGVVQNILSLPNEKLKVVYQSKQTGFSQQLEADCVINCSGPDYKIAHHIDPLIQNLLKKQIVLPDEMGFGLKLNQKEMLEGKGQGKIYAIGALLFGELFETTAVPELRQQARSIAETILFNNNH